MPNRRTDILARARELMSAYRDDELLVGKMQTTSTISRFQIQQVVRTASLLDIANNPAPEAIFDPLSLGFNIWCTPDDHPGGDWLKVVRYMDRGVFTKPCAFAATVFVKWDDEVENIIAMSLSTDAYALSDHLPALYISSARKHDSRRSIHNRPDDIAWARKKTAWIFAQAGVPCPAIIVEEK